MVYNAEKGCVITVVIKTMKRGFLCFKQLVIEFLLILSTVNQF